MFKKTFNWFKNNLLGITILCDLITAMFIKKVS
jgi:hypothetical protein